MTSTQGQGLGYGLPVLLRTHIVMTATGGYLMARQQVAAPKDEANTETEKGRGPQRTFRLGLPAGHVHPGEPMDDNIVRVQQKAMRISARLAPRGLSS